MTDLEFLDQAERLLAGVEASCDRINDESDAQEVSVLDCVRQESLRGRHRARDRSLELAELASCS